MTRLDPALWRAKEGLDRLLDALGGSGDTVRPIGGFVRDALLGQAPKDLDLATVLLPELAADRIRAAGFKVVPTGLSHGTVTALLPSGPVEVTTLRRDVATDGRHAEVAFTDDWAADAGRRDFTINALSADPANGTVFDYHGGLADLADRRVRFIGEPLVRIAEDHLRILRFFRFHARFGGEPDAPALAACAARANDLLALSRERIAMELLQLLALPDPVPTVRLMADAGIFGPILPEIDEGGPTRLAALVAREQATGIAPAALRRLAALLPADPALADAIGARLRLSKAQRARMAAAADPSPPVPARTVAHALGVESAIDRLLLHAAPDALATGLADLAGWTPPPFPLTGGALIALGLPPGPIVARTLARVRDRWVAAGFPDGDAAAILAAEAVAQALRESA